MSTNEFMLLKEQRNRNGHQTTDRWQPVAHERGHAATSLTNEEILRYSRHLIMPEVGMEGQLKLKNAKVLLIGTGGLGAPLGLVSGRGGRGQARAGGFRCGGFHELAAAGDVRVRAMWASPKRKRRGRGFRI